MAKITKYLSLVKGKWAVAQLETDLDDDEVVKVSNFLKDQGIFDKDTSLSSTYHCKNPKNITPYEDKND